jgi:hypothetical protein
MTMTKLVLTGDLDIGPNQEKMGQAIEDFNRAATDAQPPIKIGKEP